MRCAIIAAIVFAAMVQPVTAQQGGVAPEKYELAEDGSILRWVKVRSMSPSEAAEKRKEASKELQTLRSLQTLSNEQATKVWVLLGPVPTRPFREVLSEKIQERESMIDRIDSALNSIGDKESPPSR